MEHSTPQPKKSPRTETLIYITTFARLYSPETDNEQAARMAAHSTAHAYAQHVEA